MSHLEAASRPAREYDGAGSAGSIGAKRAGAYAVQGQISSAIASVRQAISELRALHRWKRACSRSASCWPIPDGSPTHPF